MGNSERYFWADVVRVIAISCVILAHIARDPFVSPDIVSQSWLSICNLVFHYCRIAIPLFVMISGALLLNPSYKIKISDFLPKRAKRILGPFLFWVTLYLLNYSRYTINQGGAVSLQELLLSVYNNQYQASNYGFLWFVYMIIGINLAVPILKKLTDNPEENLLIYCLLLWFCIVVVVPFLNDLFSARLAVKFYVMNGYVGYFLLGFWLSNKKFLKLSQLILITVLVMIFIFLLAETAFMNDPCNMNPLLILLSACVFLTVKEINYKRIRSNRFFKRIIGGISQNSYGIYLCHVLILSVLYSLKKKGIITLGALFVHPLIGIPLTFAVVLISSVTLIVLLKKVPRIGWLVG